MIDLNGSDKTARRNAALGRRDALSLEDRSRFSDAIAARVEPFARLMGTGPVGGFWPIRSEIDPRPAMRRLADAGLSLALPVITPSGMIFRAWRIGDELNAGKFGLSEPFATAPEVNPTALLVPLAAFDRRGHRIGYGAGYYDRAIARLSAHGRLFTIGICFATQEIERVPEEAHDRALDMIVTEREIIRISDGAKV